MFSSLIILSHHPRNSVIGLADWLTSVAFSGEEAESTPRVVGDSRCIEWSQITSGMITWESLGEQQLDPAGDQHDGTEGVSSDEIR